MKKIITLCLSLCMTAALAAPAYALEYSIDAPDDYDFGRNTSIEVIHTADGGAMRNEDVSKNAALIPPIFGSESMNALHMVALNAIPTAEAAMRASVVTGKVTLNGQVIDNKTAKYPLLIYSNITYFPMTYHLSRFMGVGADWNNGSKTLDIPTSAPTAVGSPGLTLTE